MSLDISPEQIAAAIYRVEGGSHTRYPYGIMSVKTSDPHRVCVNTILHAERDYKCTHVDRAFIYFLADRYCPPSVDKLGNFRWKNNMVRILNINHKMTNNLALTNHYEYIPSITLATARIAHSAHGGLYD